MEEKDFEQFMKDFESFIEDRSNIAFDKAVKNKKYKELYKKYEEQYEALIKKINVEEIDKFADFIHLLNNIENNYIYMQGFLDGILFKKNLEVDR